ncbi:MAG: NAD(P)-dependent oxidoreductase [Verrucomicrobiota bacterium]
MPALASDFRILVTGGCGFLGSHLVSALRSRFPVVALDVRNPGADEAFVEGSVTDAERVDEILEGMGGLVISHMAPRAPGVYDSPKLPFEVNVEGTALLLDAAVKRKLKRVVLISSVAVVQQSMTAGQFLSIDLLPSPDSIYGLTKALQEETARYYHSRHGLEIAILRPAYISMGDTLKDKYGVSRPSVNWQFIDPRDIGAAALAAFALEDLGCETFYLMAGPGAEQRADIRHTMARLGWTPQFRFTGFPVD